MKILVVASTFPAGPDDSVPAFVLDQVRALTRVDPGLELTVLAPHDARSGTVDHRTHPEFDEHRFHYAWPRRIERLAGHGIMPAIQANPLYLLLVPALFVGELVALWRLVRRTRPDLLYAHWFTPQAMVCRWVAALTGTPFVFTTHASDVSVWWKIPVLGPRLVRAHVRPARAFTAVSRRSMAKLEAFFDPAEWERVSRRGAIVPMGVELPDAEQVPPGPAERVLFVGRLVEKKGLPYLLRAWPEVLDRHPEAHLTIAGDGPDRPALERQVADAGLTRSVTFAGYTTGQAKDRLVATHGTYVVPSIITEAGDAEGLPVSLMEGLAAGRLCVATAESGADDIIDDGVSGLVVDQRDVAQLRDALLRLMSLDDAERTAMCTAAQQTARQFAWPTVAQDHLDLLLTPAGARP